jgi:hypothetical protein
MKGNTLDATVTAVDKLPDDYIVFPEYEESTSFDSKDNMGLQRLRTAHCGWFMW